MDIPRVTQEFLPVVSGPANQALAVALGLERMGVRSPILTTTPGDDPRAAGLRVLRFAPALALPNFRVAPALSRALLAERADAIHVHGWRNPVSDSAIRIAAARGVPLVVQAHGVAYGHRYTSDAGVVRAARAAADAAIRPALLRAARAVVAATAAEAEELRRYGFAPERIAVIPAGVAPHFFGSPERPERESVTLLSVGRLGPLRRTELLVEALAILRRRGAPAELRVVGPEVRLGAGERGGYRARLEALARELGVAEWVTFAGERGGAALAEEYARADVFVCASRYENFGQPRAEAAAAGLPLVLTPAGVGPELLAGGAAGALVPHDDAGALAAALGPLCGRPELRRRMGAEAARRAAAMFGWGQIVPRYAALYERAVGETAGARRGEGWR